MSNDATALTAARRFTELIDRILLVTEIERERVLSFAKWLFVHSGILQNLKLTFVGDRNEEATVELSAGGLLIPHRTLSMNFTYIGHMGYLMTDEGNEKRTVSEVIDALSNVISDDSKHYDPYDVSKILNVILWHYAYLGLKVSVEFEDEKSLENRLSLHFTTTVFDVPGIYEYKIIPNEKYDAADGYHFFPYNRCDTHENTPDLKYGQSDLIDLQEISCDDLTMTYPFEFPALYKVIDTFADDEDHINHITLQKMPCLDLLDELTELREEHVALYEDEDKVSNPALIGRTCMHCNKMEFKFNRNTCLAEVEEKQFVIQMSIDETPFKTNSYFSEFVPTYIYANSSRALNFFIDVAAYRFQSGYDFTI